MQTIHDFLIPYAELEKSVRERMIELFSDSCGLCTACCCRADICEETLHSAFLSMLLGMQNLGAADMDERYGWLDLRGCSLDFGRPPVCYAFFCDELIDRLPDEDTRHVIQTLGRLIHHVGYRARGTLHLVEITDPDELSLIDVGLILDRIEQSRAALAVIEEFLETGRMHESGKELLNLICSEDP